MALLKSRYQHRDGKGFGSTHVKTDNDRADSYAEWIDDLLDDLQIKYPRFNDIMLRMHQ
jgi:hypothetical protein